MKGLLVAVLLVVLQATLAAQSGVGINLSRTNYYQSDFPFVNLAKTGEWRNLDWSYRASSSLTDQAYLPQGQDGRFLVIVDSTVYPWGKAPTTLVFRYSGTADIQVEGGAVLKARAPGRLVLAVPSPFQGSLVFRVTRHTAQLGDFRLTEATEENNAALFRSQFLKQWGAFRTLRFMDLMNTNGSPYAKATDYPAADSLLETPAIHLESMVALCNLLHSDAWVCLPHLADDALVRRIAAVFRRQLDPSLRVFVEYSNECWNNTFSQASYCSSQGIQMGLDRDPHRAGLKFYALRAAQVHRLWDEAWGSQTGRLVRVVAWQAYNAPLCDEVLEAYRRVAGVEADALAIAPYFGIALGTSYPGARYADEVKNWSLDVLFAQLFSSEPSRLPLGRKDGSLAEVEVVMKAAAAVARKHRLDLVAYEAGQHLVGVGAWGDSPALNGLFRAANRDPRMGELYHRYLDLWLNAGGKEILLYCSTGIPSQYGSWGLKESADSPPNLSPKYNAVLKWIKEHSIEQ